jgi:tRNA threonylcarbamoyladenosine biosynthesis protein TsaE
MFDIPETSCGFGLNEFVFISHSPQETYSLGKCLGERLRPGDVVALTGELGAGKTYLAQGIARGLGVPEGYAVTSPTFTIINEYPGRLTLYHMDMYRLSGIKDLDDIGDNDLFSNNGVVVVEWAEKIGEILPAETLFIRLAYLDENKRKIVFSGDSSIIDNNFIKLDGGL